MTFRRGPPIEVDTGLFCASAPCILPLLRQITTHFNSPRNMVSPPLSTQRSENKTIGFGSQSTNTTSTHSWHDRHSRNHSTFELNSRSHDDHTFSGLLEGNGNTTNITSGGQSAEREDIEKSASGKHAPDRTSGSTEIVKTVSVSVTGGSAR